MNKMHQICERNGWLIECESPLEIRHSESGSFATLLAAQYLLRGLAADDGHQTVNADNIQKLFAELCFLSERATQWVAVANSTPEQEASQAWDEAYSLVFSDHLSRRVTVLLRSLNSSLSYYDPDRTSREDVEAYVRALREKVKNLGRFLRTENMPL